MKHWPIRTEAINALPAGSVIRSTNTNEPVYMKTQDDTWYPVGHEHKLTTGDIRRDAPFVVLDVVDMDAADFVALLPEEYHGAYWNLRLDEYLADATAEVSR